MEDECSPLSWAFYYQEEGVHQEEYMKHSLLYTTLELETTILSTREELARKDDELVHLKVLLTKITKERDEAIAKCHRLTLENLLLSHHHQHQHQQQQQSTSINEDEPVRRSAATATATPHHHHDYYYHSSSDSDENMINPHPHPHPHPPPPLDHHHQHQHQHHDEGELTEGCSAAAVDDDDHEMMERINFVIPKKPLPEKGKFLQAVMEAGPLLQTLLLAGPLPQWQRPPPQLSSIDIPPVTISSSPSPRVKVLLQDSSSCAPTPAADSSEYNCFSKKRAAAGVIVNSGTDSYSCPSSCMISSKYQRVGHQSPLTNNIL